MTTQALAAPTGAPASSSRVTALADGVAEQHTVDEVRAFLAVYRTLLIATNGEPISMLDIRHELERRNP